MVAESWAEKCFLSRSLKATLFSLPPKYKGRRYENAGRRSCNFRRGIKSRGIRSEPEKLRNISGDLGAPHLRPRWKEGYKAILFDGYEGSYEMPGWLLTTDPMPTGDRWGRGPNEGRQTSKVIIYRGREVVSEATAGWIALILDRGKYIVGWLYPQDLGSPAPLAATAGPERPVFGFPSYLSLQWPEDNFRTHYVPIHFRTVLGSRA